MDDKHNQNCTALKCVNCESDHASYSRECQLFIKNQEIIKIKTIDRISFHEAKAKYVREHANTTPVGMPQIPIQHNWSSTVKQGNNKTALAKNNKGDDRINISSFTKKIKHVENTRTSMSDIEPTYKDIDNTINNIPINSKNNDTNKKSNKTNNCYVLIA